MMFIAQNTVKQRPEQCLIDDHLFNNDAILSSCAWCLADQGIAAGEGSHGICKKHANSFLIQWREHRNRRMTA
jgi:hypothetical protein